MGVVTHGLSQRLVAEDGLSRKVDYHISISVKELGLCTVANNLIPRTTTKLRMLRTYRKESLEGGLDVRWSVCADRYCDVLLEEGQGDRFG